MRSQQLTAADPILATRTVVATAASVYHLSAGRQPAICLPTAYDEHLYQGVEPSAQSPHCPVLGGISKC